MADPSTSPATFPTSNRVALWAQDLAVSYRAYQSPARRIRTRVTRPWRTRQFTTVQAVRHVTLTLAKGEVLGIIGSNGSGKTTLLRALAGLQTPVSGAVWAISYPVLLGVGSALKPALSGRRNVRLGALALGISRADLPQREREIIEFAALGDAIDRPMKTYSAGMRARLQFAIATTLQPDILLLDEALTVGDRSFKQRSMERLDHLRQNAAAVIIVAHAMPEIRRICNRVIWLDGGQIIADGDPASVTRQYESL